MIAFIYLESCKVIQYTIFIEKKLISLIFDFIFVQNMFGFGISYNKNNNIEQDYYYDVRGWKWE